MLKDHTRRARRFASVVVVVAFAMTLGSSAGAAPAAPTPPSITVSGSCSGPVSVTWTGYTGIKGVNFVYYDANQVFIDGSGHGISGRFSKDDTVEDAGFAGASYVQVQLLDRKGNHDGDTGLVACS